MRVSAISLSKLFRSHLRQEWVVISGSDIQCAIQASALKCNMENVSAVHSTVIYTLRHILFDMSYVSQIRRSQFQQSKSHGFKSTGPVSNLAKTSSMCFVISLSSSKNAIYCLFVISNHKPHLSILLQSFLEMLRSSVILYCCQNPPFMGLWLSFAWENAVKCKSMGSLFFTNFHVIKFTGKIEKQRKRNRHFTCALALRVKFASVFSSKLSFLSCKRQKHECGSWRNKPIPSRNKLGRTPRESWWPKLLDASSYFFTTLKPHDLVPFDLFF